MSREPHIMICISTPYDKNWSSYGNTNMWPTFWLGDVHDDVKKV